jgi:hypothetical protein
MEQQVARGAGSYSASIHGLASRLESGAVGARPAGDLLLHPFQSATGSFA